MSRLLAMFLVMGFAYMSHAADGKAFYSRYRTIIDDKGKPAADRDKRGQEYLRALDSADFLAFIREVAQQSGYGDQREGHIVAMVVFAKSYQMGPGRNEPLCNTLKQFSDTTLPAAWKIGLLDVVKPENRGDLSEVEVATVTAVLMEGGQRKQNEQDFDMFRIVYLQKLGSFLYSQRELITQKAPELKDALEKQDKTSLPKKDDANVKRAAKLIDAIQDYRAALQKTADEVKDEQIKANLKKRLAKWDPVSITPTK